MVKEINTIIEKVYKQNLIKAPNDFIGALGKTEYEFKEKWIDYLKLNYL